MDPYFEDLLRIRIVRAIEEGTSKSAAAHLFDVSLSSVKRYLRRVSRGESLAPKKGGGRPPKVDSNTRKLLEENVKKRPAATISERRHFLEQLTVKALSDSTVGRFLRRMGFSQKTERGGAGTGRVLEGCLEGDGFAKGADPQRFFFVDEIGTDTSLSPLYARSRRGQRAWCSVPRNRGPHTTLLSSMSIGGMGPSLAVVGSTTAEVFEVSTSRRCSLRAYEVGSLW